MCKQALIKYGNSSVSLALTISDRQIVPILTYAIPTWGAPIINHIIRLRNVSPTTGSASDYLRNYINTTCQKEIRVKK